MAVVISWGNEPAVALEPDGEPGIAPASMTWLELRPCAKQHLHFLACWADGTQVIGTYDENEWAADPELSTEQSEITKAEVAQLVTQVLEYKLRSTS